ncbi:hypothetical protein L4D08_23250 [Photobacterium chitinilyticum]|uniref:hypothetical protein n=1 Tax=Photobacterium chitinilyticum TaxID=2485123 RepID=UPI003D0F07E0
MSIRRLAYILLFLSPPLSLATCDLTEPQIINNISSSGNVKTYTIDYIIVHPEHRNTAELNEIALLKISETMIFESFNDTEFPSDTWIKLLSEEKQAINLTLNLCM